MKEKIRKDKNPRDKWWNIKDEILALFKDKVMEEDK